MNKTFDCLLQFCSKNEFSLKIKKSSINLITTMDIQPQIPATQPQQSQYQLPNIPLQIQCDMNTLTFPSGTFSFDQQGFQYICSHMHLHCRYEDTNSIGSYQLQLAIFINDPEGQTQQPNYELFDLLQQAYSKPSTEPKHFNLQGPYEVRLSFSDYGKEALKEIYTKMNQFSALKTEEEGDFNMEEMITADDIDEQGNVVVGAGEEEEEEEEKEEM